jgi:replication factor A1
MSLHEIVNRILSSRSDLKREEIMEMIEKKKKAAGNFLTDETAARITAQELGIEIAKQPAKLKIEIRDLVSGLNDVTLTGQVTAIYPPKTFKRRDWTEGKLASLVVSDQTGTLRVVLWDEKVELVQTKNIQQNQTIKISHGYVRQGLDGKPELHLGQRGTIKVLKKPE